MCLVIPYGESIRIANEDITVYKFVLRRWNRWVPPVKRNHKFKYNTILTALDKCGNPIEHLVRTGYRNDIICEGFHCDTIDSCTNSFCIIPKDAEYCYGIDNEIVSTKLIVFKYRWNYWWYKLWHR